MYLFRIITIIALTIPFTGLAGTPGQTKPSLQIGMLPYLSTHKLINVMKPLKNYLEAQLNRKVVLVTAPDFRSYMQRSLEGAYDIYLTAPHFAALAESKAGHHRLSGLSRVLDGSIIVAKNGGIQNVLDLKHKILATPDRLAIITMLGENLVRNQGIQPGRDITIRHMISHNSAILSVVNGKADAAVASAAIFENMPQNIKNQLAILTTTEKVPHAMFMAKADLPEEDILSAREAFLAFTADGPGKIYFARTGQGTMQKITNEHMKLLSPFMKTLQERLR